MENKGLLDTFHWNALKILENIQDVSEMLGQGYQID